MQVGLCVRGSIRGLDAHRRRGLRGFGEQGFEGFYAVLWLWPGAVWLRALRKDIKRAMHPLDFGTRTFNLAREQGRIVFERVSTLVIKHRVLSYVGTWPVTTRRPSYL